MNRLRAVPLLVAVCWLAPLESQQAQAQWGGWGNGFGFGSPYNWAVSERPPYFAIHPPVYYRHPVAHNYGYSPYARPAMLWSQADNSSRSVVIYNHYVSGNAPAAAEKPIEPLMITNPHFKPDAKSEVVPAPMPKAGQK